MDSALPEQQGLYDRTNEHDACGVGFVAHIKGKKSHTIIDQGLLILKNLDHRGAVGADPLMGDGAGILIQIPDAFFRAEMAAQGVNLPRAGDYGVGMVFLPKESASRLACQEEIERAVRAEGQVVLGWRDVPVDRTMPMFSVAMHFDEDGFPTHPMRDPAYRSDNVLISTAGFPVAEHNFELLTGYMQRRFRSRYKGAVTMPQGELLRSDPSNPSPPEIKNAINAYLEKVSEAGACFMKCGKLSAEIQSELKKPILDPEDYMAGINAFAETLPDARDHSQEITQTGGNLQ